MKVSKFKLKGERFSLGINTDFFLLRTVRHWSRLPGDIVQPPSWDSLKARLDKVLRCLVWPQSWPYFHRRLGERPPWPLQTWILLSFLKQVLTVCFLMTAPTHTEAHSHPCPPHIRPDPRHKSHQQLVLSTQKNQSPSCDSVSLSSPHLQMCKKGFSGKQGYKTVLNGSVLRQITFFSNISCLSLIANIIVRALSKENVLKEKFMLCFELIFKQLFLSNIW